MDRIAEDFAARRTEAARTFYNLGKDARDWQVQLAQKDVRRHDGRIRPVLYRPFDRRFTYYTGKSHGFICMPRPEVMRHMLAGENLGLSTTRSKEIGGGWEHIFASRHLIQHHTVSLKEVNYLFPLYTFPPEALANAVNPREPNLDTKFTRAFAVAVGLEFIPDGSGNLASTFGPEDVFYYLYAVLHSPEYRRRYADFLKSDFPRVPLPGDRALFADLIRPGARLVNLHLMEAEDRRAGPTFSNTGSNQVDKVRYAPPSSGLQGRVLIKWGIHLTQVAPRRCGLVDPWTPAHCTQNAPWGARRRSAGNWATRLRFGPIKDYARAMAIAGLETWCYRQAFPGAANGQPQYVVVT